MILVCDQAETERGGVVTPAVRDLLIELTAATPDKLFGSIRACGIEHFRNVIAKPNAMEAEQACLRAFQTSRLPRLREDLRFQAAAGDRGEKGVRVIGPDGQDRRVPVRKVKAVDICGAGDSFSAGAACALAATAIRWKRPGSAIWWRPSPCRRPGTGTASPEEVIAAAQESR